MFRSRQALQEGWIQESQQAIVNCQQAYLASIDPFFDQLLRRLDILDAMRLHTSQLKARDEARTCHNE
jgi:hypothetical protein